VVGAKVRQQIKVFVMFSVALFMVAFAHVLQARGEGAIGAALGLTAVALSLAMILEAQHS
jgi:hypothetical protein